MRLPLQRLFFAIFMVTAVAPARALAMRCDHKLISVGDAAYTLQQKCGPADFITSQPVAATTAYVGSATALSTTADIEMVETWVYRGDPGQMASFVEVRKGTVAGIRRVKLLTVDDPVRCQKVVDSGDEIGKIRLACGAPVDVSQWQEERSIIQNGLQLRQLVNHERWFYDLGAGRFLRILNFENGVLTSVDAGRRQ